MSSDQPETLPASPSAPTGPAMTRREREDLLKLVRQRERVAKSAAAARSQHLLAEFEAQLDRRYHFDEDAVWAAAKKSAEAIVAQANIEIAQQCQKLGIPAECAPGLDLAWYGRGRNAARSERDEMRRLARRRIEAIETQARLAIEQASVHAQERLWADGITTEAAQGFLAALPTVETLMPALDVAQIQHDLSAPKALAASARFAQLPSEDA